MKSEGTKKMGKVLDREINPKLGNGTWFWEDLVSIPAAVLTFPKSLRGWSDSCSGYFLLKQGVVLPQFGGWKCCMPSFK